jgi:hypothetical protein
MAHITLKKLQNLYIFYVRMQLASKTGAMLG